MNTILVWMLITISSSSYNTGNVTVVAHFKDLQQCQHVQQAITIDTYGFKTKCIQANIVK